MQQSLAVAISTDRKKDIMIEQLDKVGSNVRKFIVFFEKISFSHREVGLLNKKASGAQCFIMALGLFWDIMTGLP